MSSSLTVVPPAPLAPVQPTAAPEVQLPFDPRRLLGGFIARKRWIVLAAVVGLLAGAGLGLFRSETRYEVSVQLMKREIPSGFRASDFGEAFKPRVINNATLIGIALSETVLTRVVNKAHPAVSLALLRRSVEANEQKGTDFVMLTVSGYSSPADTVALANLWGQEIVEFSRELQVRESREVRTYVQKQIELADADIRRLNREMIDVSQREGVVDADRQIEAYLRLLNELDLKIQALHSNLSSSELQLRSMEAELDHLIPLNERIDQLQREIINAQTTSGEASTVTQDLRLQMTKLQADYRRQQKKEYNPTSASSTTLGTTLFLQVMQARSQRESGLRELPELERMRADVQQKLAAMPEKAAHFAQLQQQRAALEAPRHIMTARLSEAQHFEENASGYFQVFTHANVGEVAVRPFWLKLLVFGAGGLAVATALGTVGAIGAELIDSRLRTSAEASRLYRSPVWSNLSRHDGRSAWRGAVERLWLQWISTRDGFAAPLAMWSAIPGPTEEQFWEIVIDEARRLLDGMLIVDVGEEWSPQLASLPIASGEPILGVQSLRVDPHSISVADAERLVDRLAAIGQTTLVCVRFAGAVREPVTTIAQACAPALVFVNADIARLDFWEKHANLLRSAVKAPAGLILADESELFHAI